MAWIRLDCKVDAAVSLQVVVPVEALRTLVALERPVVRRARASVHRMRRVSAIHLLHASHMSAVEAWENPRLQRAHYRHLPTRAVDVGHHRSCHCRQRI